MTRAMKRFRMDNTDGYSQPELDEMNQAFEQIMADNYDPDSLANGYYDSIEYKSWQDHIAETILSSTEK